MRERATALARLATLAKQHAEHARRIAVSDNAQVLNRNAAEVSAFNAMIVALVALNDTSAALSSAATTLASFADNLERLQKEAANAVRAADAQRVANPFALTLLTSPPGQSQSESAQQLRRQAAAALENSSETLVPWQPSIFDQFIVGFYEGGSALVASVVWTTERNFMINPIGAAQKWFETVQESIPAFEAFKSDPQKFTSELVSSVLQVDLYREDPARWAGHMTVGALALLATKGVGGALKVSSATERIAGGLIQTRVNPLSTYNRPSFRTTTRAQVWENAKGTDGQVRDPQTGRAIDPSEPWDVGHAPGFEFWKHVNSASARDIDRATFLDEYNDVNHLRPELPSSNRNHQSEEPPSRYYGP